MNKFFKSIRSFAIEEDGAQVIEYALIIAVVSIALIVAISNLDNGLSGFVTRVENCLSGSGCTAVPVGGGGTPTTP
jgi:pilus assembly protein Flp/PilA